MAKANTSNKSNRINEARMKAACEAWLEEDEAYHAQFDTEDDSDTKFYMRRARSSNGEFENGIGISVGDYW